MARALLKSAALAARFARQRERATVYSWSPRGDGARRLHGGATYPVYATGNSRWRRSRHSGRPHAGRDDPSTRVGRRSVVTRVPVLRPIVLALCRRRRGTARSALASWPGGRRADQAAVHDRDRSQRRSVDRPSRSWGRPMTRRSECPSRRVRWGTPAVRLLAGLFGRACSSARCRADRAACWTPRCWPRRAAISGGTPALYRHDQPRCAAHPPIWDMGRSRQRRPRALDLFRNVLTASQAFRALFRPFSSTWKHRDRVCGNARRWRRDDEIWIVPRPCCCPARRCFRPTRVRRSIS